MVLKDDLMHLVKGHAKQVHLLSYLTVAPVKSDFPNAHSLISFPAASDGV